MKKYHVNVRQEFIFPVDVIAEDEEHAKWKAMRQGRAIGLKNWNIGRCEAYCRRVKEEQK